MSRITVTIHYFGSSAVLRTPEKGEPEGKYLWAIKPGEVVNLDGLGEAFYARQVDYAGERRISLVRVGADERRLGASALKRRTNGRQGVVLTPGRWEWAITARSARHGLAHRAKPATGSITGLLHLFGLTASDVYRREAATVAGKYYDYDWQDVGRAQKIVVVTDSATIADPDDVPTQPGRYYGVYKNRRNRVFVVDDSATFVVEVIHRGESKTIPRRVRVIHTPGADRLAIADAIARGLFDSEKADHGLIRAMESYEAAKKWVVTHFDATELGGDEVTDPVLKRLVTQWGTSVLS